MTTSRLYSGPESEESLAAVRAERDFWRDLFETVVRELPEPALVVDDAGEIAYWNDACE